MEENNNSIFDEHVNDSAKDSSQNRPPPNPVPARQSSSENDYSQMYTANEAGSTPQEQPQGSSEYTVVAESTVENSGKNQVAHMHAI